MMLQKEQVLYAFKAWGFLPIGETESQHHGTCPFCDKDKFYVHKVRALWDCKVCGISGNYFQFLERVWGYAKKEFHEPQMKALCIDRKLPRAAFAHLPLGYWNDKYVIAVHGETGRLQDLRGYKIGDKVKSSVGCHVGLLGAMDLVNTDLSIPVYLCEGEWDTVALRWLLGFLKKPGVVVGVPGANTFKRDWCGFFQGRDVYCCYDNDPAGENGEIVARDRLTGVAKSIRYMHWAPSLPTGFDLRDLIVVEAIKHKKPIKTFKMIAGMFAPKVRKERYQPPADAPADGSGKPQDETPGAPPEKVTLRQVQTVYAKWLYLKDLTPVEVMLAVAASNWLEGDPLWVFLVAPPGGAKTEIINGLSTSDSVFFTSSLTPHSLISGAAVNFGKDPSLIPQLNGKILAIKDFTTVLDGQERDKEEIFGILRDAYDGTCGKVFGNGIRRIYKSRFTVISGVTEKIYKTGSHQQALGERFLKYCIEGSLDRPHEQDVLERCVENLSHESEMRGEISNVVKKFLLYIQTTVPANTREYPKISKEYVKKLTALALYGARMRGVVARDKYRSDMIDSRPSAEIGSRLVKQLAKFAISLAFINGRTEVSEKEYSICRKMMLDTISQRNEDIVCKLMQKCPRPNDTLKTRDLSYMTNYTQSTVARVLSDMQMLEIVKRVGKPNAYQWTIAPYLRDLIERAGLYQDLKEMKREKPFMARVRITPGGRVFVRKAVKL